MKNRLLHVGKIGRAHGRFGEVRVRLFHDSYELLSPDTTFYLDGKLDQTIQIESVRHANKFYLVRFQGFQYRDEAKSLTNLNLWVDRNDMPPTSEDEYYCADLVGFDVYAYNSTQHDPNDTTNVGKVYGFLDNVETDVMIVQGPKTLNRWLIPFISAVVIDVDVEKQTIFLEELSQWTHEDQTLLD